MLWRESVESAWGIEVGENPGWEARTRSLSGPLSPRGPQPVDGL